MFESEIGSDSIQCSKLSGLCLFLQYLYILSKEKFYVSKMYPAYVYLKLPPFLSSYITCTVKNDIS